MKGVSKVLVNEALYREENERALNLLELRKAALAKLDFASEALHRIDFLIAQEKLEMLTNQLFGKK